MVNLNKRMNRPSPVGRSTRAEIQLQSEEKQSLPPETQVFPNGSKYINVHSVGMQITVVS